MRLHRLFDLYFEEDCPYIDETCEFLEIEGSGRMEILSREPGIAACTEDLGEYLTCKGLKVHYIRSGEQFEPGRIFLAEGDLKKIFAYWRVSQTFLSITCAIATKTRELVEKARSVNPNVLVATTRKTHPGMRYFELKAVIAGGGAVHRNSLSDSILITPNHLRVLGVEVGKVEAAVEAIRSLRKKCMRHVEIEPNKEDVERYAEYADLLLLDHYSPEELGTLVPRLKAANPGLKVAIAGNVGENVADYAKYADVIVTSAPYYAKPLDLTCRIERV